MNIHRRAVSGIFAVVAFIVMPWMQTVSAYTASMTVSSTATQTPLSRYVWGVNYESYTRYTTAAEFLATIDAAKLSELGATRIRFPGGCGADYYDWKTGKMRYKHAADPAQDYQFLQVDDAITIANTINGDILYQMNIDDGTTPNYCNAVSQNPGTVASAQDFMNAYKGVIKYIELGNEQWINWAPTKYATVAVQYASAIKAIDPQVKIGLIGYGSGESETNRTAWTAMVKQLFNSTCGTQKCFDFVTDHPSMASSHQPPFDGMSAYLPLTNKGAVFDRRKSDYTPLDVHDTEWNIPCWDNPPQPPSGTVEHGLATFFTLFQMATHGVTSANYHDFTAFNWAYDGSGSGNGCSLFASPTTFTPAGAAFSISSATAGGVQYASQITSPSNTIAADTTCDPANNSCIKGGVQIPYLQGYSLRQNLTMILYLVNLNTTENADVSVALTNFPTVTTRTALVKTLTAGALTDTAYTPADSQIQVVNSLNISVAPMSIVRIAIPNQFVNIPTPTQAVTRPPKFITTIPADDDGRDDDQGFSLLLYIIASAVYIMTIHFAVAMKNEFKLNIIVSCFVLGAAIGLFLHALEIGFIVAVVRSLVLW